MTAKEFEDVGKEYVYKKIMAKKDLSEDEKMKEAKKKLAEIVKKQIYEKNDKKVEEYKDTVQLTKEGWKERYYSSKFHVRGEAELKEFCKNIR